MRIWGSWPIHISYRSECGPRVSNEVSFDFGIRRAAKGHDMGSRLRNRESAIAERIGQLVALLLLVIIFAPAIRKLPLTLGIILTIAVLAIAVALGVMFIRRTKRRSPRC